MNIIKNIIFIVVTACFLSACGPGLKATPNVNSFYGGSAPLKATDYQTTKSRVYNYTFDEVFDASVDAIMRTGYSVDVEDREAGLISGSGLNRRHGVNGPLSCNITYAIYVEEVNTKPRTKSTVIVDVHSSTMFLWSAGPETSLIVNSEISDQLQKILASY